jgi:hypothetical protein
MHNQDGRYPIKSVFSFLKEERIARQNKLFRKKIKIIIREDLRNYEKSQETYLGSFMLSNDG